MLLLTILRGGKIGAASSLGVHHQRRQIDITQPRLLTTLHDNIFTIHTLLNDLSRRGEKGGESICKPGSVLNSHSSTMAITGHL